MEEKGSDTQVISPTSSKIRIAFVLWTLKSMGGSEHVVFDIVRKLDHTKFHILVVGLDEGPVRNIYEEIGVKVEVVSKKKKFDFNFIKRFRHILLSEKIEIVNPHHFSPLLYTSFACINTGIKIVYTEHSVWQYLELGWGKKLLSNMLLSNVDAVVAISKQLFDYYADNYFVSAKKNHLIINGIDLNRFHKLNNSSFKESLGFKPEDKLIGLVANLRPEKNHKVLIRSLSRIVKNDKSIHLVFAGIDYMDGELHEYSEQFGVSDRVLFLGSRDDVPDILNILDVFCLPSKNEGLPLSILEAMACGVPVVGSNVMGINEVVTDNMTGLLFPYDDETALCEKINLLLSEHEVSETIIAKSLEYVKENYCLEDKMDQYFSLFQTLVNKENTN